MNLIKQKIIEIVSVPPKKEGDTGYLKLTKKEIDKIVELFKETIQRFIEETNKELREELAELEHKQWESWTRYIIEHLFDAYEQGKGNSNDEIAQMKGLGWLIEKELVPMMKKWQKNWKPYSELSEEEKDKDRIWADKVLGKLKQEQAKWLKENL